MKTKSSDWKDKVEFKWLDSQRGRHYPVFRQYHDLNRPQPAFLYLDSDGNVWFNYASEVGDCMPEEVWHRRVLRYPVFERISAAEMEQCFKEHEELLQRVHDGHQLEWDSDTHTLYGELATIGAQEAEEALTQSLVECMAHLYLDGHYATHPEDHPEEN